MLLVVLTILNVCVLVFCVVSVVLSEFMALSMVFSMWTGPGFESCSEFLIFQ